MKKSLTFGDGLDLLVGKVSFADTDHQPLEGPLPNDRKSYIVTEIRLEKTNANVKIEGLPRVEVEALADGVYVLAHKTIPFMSVGERIVLDIPYDPRMYSGMESPSELKIEISSPFHFEGEDTKINDTFTIPMTPSDNQSHGDGSGGGGCEVFSASVLIILAAALALKFTERRRRTKR
jgi:hypothetical protein